MSFEQVCDSDKEIARSKYCSNFATEELIFTELSLRSSYPVFLEFCKGFSVPKYVYRVSLDEVGTADILEVENATLKGSDRDMLLSALSSRVNNDRLCIADKDNNIYVTNSEEPGTFTVSKYQYESNNQVVDFTYGFDLSRNDDYNEALEALNPRPRLAVFQCMVVTCSR